MLTLLNQDLNKNNQMKPVIHTPTINLNEVLQEGKKYLKKLPKRKLSVSSDGYAYTTTRWSRVPRRISKAWNLEDTKNTLERELVLRLAWTKDNYIAEDPVIWNFRQLLLRCAWDKDIREHLKNCSTEYTQVINSKYKAIDISPQIEDLARKLYIVFISWLHLSREDLVMIETFSWEWKSTFRHCPNYCKCWVVIVCIMQMIDLDKE